MKLIIIFGPQAVGKMTVGHELEKITDLKLFHNHMTIDLVSPFFSYGSDVGKRLVNLFRKEIFEEVAKSDLEGLIFTYVWEFDQKSDHDYVNNLCNIFESNGGSVYFVELEADAQERIERNKSSHRLDHKLSKRDIEKSEKDLMDSIKNHRLNSRRGEITRENYIRIDNTNLSPQDVAKSILEKFQLKLREINFSHADRRYIADTFTKSQ
ncbi:MAG TPA: shikimate kinase [Candidatus Moranbacteria bacterium]|nr:shikimate kinase [Candidatus Moranbacteria bacterium]